MSKDILNDARKTLEFLLDNANQVDGAIRTRINKKNSSIENAANSIRNEINVILFVWMMAAADFNRTKELANYPILTHSFNGIKFDPSTDNKDLSEMIAMAYWITCLPDAPITNGLMDKIATKNPLILGCGMIVGINICYFALPFLAAPMVLLPPVLALTGVGVAALAVFVICLSVIALTVGLVQLANKSHNDKVEVYKQHNHVKELTIDEMKPVSIATARDGFFATSTNTPISRLNLSSVLNESDENRDRKFREIEANLDVNVLLANFKPA